jgi:hypothetical protein
MTEILDIAHLRWKRNDNVSDAVSASMLRWHDGRENLLWWIR